MSEDYVTCLEGIDGVLHTGLLCMADVKNLNKLETDTEKTRYIVQFDLDCNIWPLSRYNIIGENHCYILWVKYKIKERFQPNLSRGDLVPNSYFSWLKRYLYANLRKQVSKNLRIVLAKFTDRSFTKLQNISDGDLVHRFARYYHSEKLKKELSLNPINGRHPKKEEIDEDDVDHM